LFIVMQVTGRIRWTDRFALKAPAPTLSVTHPAN
jgi:hypothetical protein